MRQWLGCVGGLLMVLAAYAAEAPVTVTRGDWSATMGPGGLALSYAGEVVSKGSYVNVFTPGYKGTVIGTAGAWKPGTARASADGKTVTLTADLPGGRLVYEAALEDAGVRITLRVTPAAGAEVGPVEYSVAQVPAEFLTGAVIEMANVAGSVTASLALPTEPANGGLAPGGPVMAFKTPKHNLIFEAPDFGTVYPFDGRHDKYGSRQGIWAFAGPAMRAGEETVSVYTVRMEPPTPPRVPGKITIGKSTPASGILLAPGATKRETLAADELANYLETMAGKRLERTEASGKTAPAGAIVIGPQALATGLIKQSELDKVAPDGYVVKVKGGRVGICGARDVGTIYGAYALLRKLGCKFYAPSCEVVPHVTALTIPDCSLSDKPFYEFRNLAANVKLGNTPKDDMMSPAELGEEGNIVHSSAYLLPYDKYHQEHPEYFALQKDGRRLSREFHGPDLNVHLCLSNPEVRRISAERMLALMDKQSDRRFFGVSQGDGFAWCQCDQCKALDAIPGVEMTDRLLDYVNYIAREVAKKYPDKRILTLAYTDATSPPPTRVMPEPNVMVQYCPYPHRTDCSSHDLTCEKNKQGQADVMAWFAKCPRNIYIFDYPTGYQNWYEPFGSFWAMKRKLDLYARNGVQGIFYCGTPQNFRNLFIYVQSELLWHPNTPVEPLIADFMQAYYGAAAPSVRQYFDFLSKEVDERPIHQQCEAASPHTVTAEYADKALAMLTQAEDVVRNDRACLYRVQAEKLCVLFGDLNARNPVNGKLAIGEAAFAQRLAEFAAIGRSQRLSQFIRRVTGEEWLYKIARLRVTRSPWYADPVMERLIRDPAGTLAREQQKYAQTAIQGGWRLELEGFRGPVGPQDYAQECPSRRAIWIYGVGSANPAMWTVLHLDAAPQKPARLVLTAQDDDKPGTVAIRVTVNGQTVFEGPNTCAEHNWSAQEIAVPAGVLKAGDNEIRIVTTQPSKAFDQGWFMLAECAVLVE
ncbi:DUF4838 domain-containing protein [bacterium]|nr:DUF4838 domain-containing protein [bacterium]